MEEIFDSLTKGLKFDPRVNGDAIKLFSKYSTKYTLKYIRVDLTLLNL
jgi:hypothetical protein